jgi:hypothetical protein
MQDNRADREHKKDQRFSGLSWLGRRREHEERDTITGSSRVGGKGGKTQPKCNSMHRDIQEASTPPRRDQTYSSCSPKSPARYCLREEYGQGKSWKADSLFCALIIEPSKRAHSIQLRWRRLLLTHRNEGEGRPMNSSHMPRSRPNPCRAFVGNRAWGPRTLRSGLVRGVGALPSWEPGDGALVKPSLIMALWFSLGGLFNISSF